MNKVILELLDEAQQHIADAKTNLAIDYGTNSILDCLIQSQNAIVEILIEMNSEKEEEREI